jgi:hypothetical protein
MVLCINDKMTFLKYQDALYIRKHMYMYVGFEA